MTKVEWFERVRVKETSRKWGKRVKDKKLWGKAGAAKRRRAAKLHRKGR